MTIRAVSGRLAFGVASLVVMMAAVATARASVITYDVNLTFDPNASPTFTLGAAGPGTVKGTFSIDTSIPIASSPVGNLAGVNLTESSNNGTVLSGFSNSATQMFKSITPYDIIFIGSPVTEYPALSTQFTQPQTLALFERVTFNSGPVIDSIQEGPSIFIDFAFPSGGSVIPGNFDSIATTGFNAYLYGTVTPEAPSAVSLPASMGMFGGAIAGLLGYAGLRRERRDSTRA